MVDLPDLSGTTGYSALIHYYDVAKYVKDKPTDPDTDPDQFAKNLAQSVKNVWKTELGRSDFGTIAEAWQEDNVLSVSKHYMINRESLHMYQNRFKLFLFIIMFTGICLGRISLVPRAVASSVEIQENTKLTEAYSLSADWIHEKEAFVWEPPLKTSPILQGTTIGKTIKEEEALYDTTSHLLQNIPFLKD